MFTVRSQPTPRRRPARLLVIAFTAVLLLLAVEVPTAGAAANGQATRSGSEPSSEVRDATRQLWSSLQERQAAQARDTEAYLAGLAAEQQASRIDAVLEAGRARIGTPYRLGGVGPGSFDCSGFTRWAWQAAGVELPHYSGAQWKMAQKVSVDELQPGDLVFYWGRGGGDPSHVALYVGDGQILHAPGTGRSVRYDSLWYWTGAKVAAGRVG